MMILSVLFHCNGEENSLSDCSSSFIKDMLSCHIIAAVECGGITCSYILLIHVKIWPFILTVTCMPTFLL